MFIFCRLSSMCASCSCSPVFSSVAIGAVVRYSPKKAKKKSCNSVAYMLNNT